jgi:predicted DsbA family dithiol-disulfide isomerase
MFRAYFEDLENISDLDTVVRIGTESGLDAASLRAALEEGRYRDRVDEGLTWSRSIGVTAIPTFVFNGRYGMVGAQELEMFRTMMAKIDQPPKS